MFFEKELLVLNFLDVLELRQEHVNTTNTGRNFDALSFRIHSEACLQTAQDSYHVGDDTVCFVPARLNYTRVATREHLIVIHFHTANCVFQKIECFLPQNSEVLESLFRKILLIWNSKKRGYQYKCTALLYEILAECHIQNGRDDLSHSKIRQSVDYLNKNFKNAALSIAEIAKQSFMSEVYFRKLFREEFGMSPQKYIIKLRIQNAVELISTGYYSLKEIAYLSGYSDYKYFSVEFKRIMGVSPSEYSYNYR